jgi:hypothetical protein
MSSTDTTTATPVVVPPSAAATSKTALPNIYWILLAQGATVNPQMRLQLHTTIQDGGRQKGLLLRGPFRSATGDMFIVNAALPLSDSVITRLKSFNGVIGITTTNPNLQGQQHAQLQSLGLDKQKRLPPTIKNIQQQQLYAALKQQSKAVAANKKRVVAPKAVVRPKSAGVHPNAVVPLPTAMKAKAKVVAPPPKKKSASPSSATATQTSAPATETKSETATAPADVSTATATTSESAPVQQEQKQQSSSSTTTETQTTPPPPPPPQEKKGLIASMFSKFGKKQHPAAKKVEKHKTEKQTPPPLPLPPVPVPPPLPQTVDTKHVLANPPLPPPLPAVPPQTQADATATSNTATVTVQSDGKNNVYVQH